MKERLLIMFDRLRSHCIVDFELNGALGSRAYALKSNMAPIRFDVNNLRLPLPLLGLHDRGYMKLQTAVSFGQIVAVFVASEGYIDNSDVFDFTIDWANVDKPDFLWLELVSRQLRHYEAFFINRSSGDPELEQIPQDKIQTGTTLFTEMFKLHS